MSAVANDLEVTKSYIIWKLINFSQQCKTWTYSGDVSLDNLIIRNVGSNVKLQLVLDTLISSKKNLTSTDILQKSTAKLCFELAIVDSTGNKVNTQMSHLVTKSGMTLLYGGGTNLIRRDYLLSLTRSVFSETRKRPLIIGYPFTIHLISSTCQ